MAPALADETLQMIAATMPQSESYLSCHTGLARVW